MDLDYYRAKQLPADYDTDLGSIGSNPIGIELDSERNQFYQRELAVKINDRMAEMLALLTKTSLIHLNRGQSMLINTASVVLSLESLSKESLSDKTIEQSGQTLISFPPNFTLSNSESRSISIRVRVSLLFTKGCR